MKIRQMALKWGLKGNKEGWLLIQSGNGYDLKPVEWDTDAHAYRVETDSGDKFFEDENMLMRQLMGTPIGLATDETRTIVNATVAKQAAALNNKNEDHGTLEPTDHLTVNEIMKSMDVGTVHTSKGPAHIVNPFHRLEDEPSIVDIRPVIRMLTNETLPDTPRKAAKNAVEAERAVKGLDWSSASQIVGMIGSFLMGALVTEYIAGSSGGGGVDVPLQLGHLAISILPSVGL